MPTNSFATALAGANISNVVQQLQAINTRQAELETARNRAHTRIGEIGRDIADIRAGHVDGEPAKEALLAGEAVTVATTSISALEAERDALMAALKAIHAEDGELARTAHDLRNSALQVLNDTISPVVADMRHRAEGLIAELAQIDADARTIAYSLRHPDATRLDDQLRARMRKFASELSPKLMKSTQFQASAQIVDALSEYEHRFTLGIGMPATVSMAA